MPRLDFENQFARQLKQREIQPSAQSWEKLQEKLEREGKGKSPFYLWVGLAASLVGAVLVFSFLFNEPVSQGPERIVDTEIKNPEKAPEVVKESVPQLAVEEPKAALEGKGKAETHRKSSGSEGFEGPGRETNPSEIHTITGDTGLALEEVPEEGEVSDSEIDALLAQAIAQVSAKMPAAGEISDAEIDALLAEARAEVKKERILSQTATFEAEDLLLEVETELEHSFREQVFEIVKDGLRKTRNAVVNINE